MENYFKSFIIGSSLPVFAPFFYFTSRIPTTERNYSYYHYSLIAPLYFGLLNVFSIWIKNQFNLSLRNTYLIIGPLSGIFVAIIASYLNTYNYKKNQWLIYYATLIFSHFFIFNVIIYFIQSLFNE